MVYGKNAFDGIAEMSIEIVNIITTIRGAASVRKIILFGSAARGESNPDSDIDILVIVPDGTHRRKTAQTIHRAIFVKKIDCAVDVVVATESDLVNHAEDFWTVIYPALRDGKTLYAA